MPEKIAFICVNVAHREGTYFATSPDLPGLYLCGRSQQDVKEDIAPMIERIYMLNKGLKVRAARAVDAESFDAPKSNGDHMKYWAAPLEAMAA